MAAREKLPENASFGTIFIWPAAIAAPSFTALLFCRRQGCHGDAAVIATIRALIVAGIATARSF